MTLEVPSTIRLETAYFCLSCEVITNCADICPACGHRKLWHLENWLGRVHGQENSGDEKGTLALSSIKGKSEGLALGLTPKSYPGGCTLENNPQIEMLFDAELKQKFSQLTSKEMKCP